MTALGSLLVMFLACCALCLVAIFRKRRLKLHVKSWLASFSFEADDDSRPDV